MLSVKTTVATSWSPRLPLPRSSLYLHQDQSLSSFLGSTTNPSELSPRSLPSIVKDDAQHPPHRNSNPDHPKSIQDQPLRVAYRTSSSTSRRQTRTACIRHAIPRPPPLTNQCATGTTSSSFATAPKHISVISNWAT